MRPYDSYKYIYPPRPESVAPPSLLSKIDDGTYIGQPKLNGSCATLATNGKEIVFMTRHKDEFKNKLLISEEELKALHRGTGWIYICGEYMNKSQKDASKKTFNGKFVIWDILVFESEWLIGITLENRLETLAKLYPGTYYDGWIEQISENCFRDISFDNDLATKWKEVIVPDMYEGMVFKRKNALLEPGWNEKNNTGWQMKIRKPTKNYSY